MKANVAVCTTLHQVNRIYTNLITKNDYKSGFQLRAICLSNVNAEPQHDLTFMTAKQNIFDILNVPLCKAFFATAWTIKMRKSFFCSVVGHCVIFRKSFFNRILLFFSRLWSFLKLYHWPKRPRLMSSSSCPSNITHSHAISLFKPSYMNWI